MKINWGIGILIFFIFYIALLIFTVFKSRTIDNSMVMANYYDYDLTYQKHFESMTNRKLLKTDLLINHSKADEILSLDFGQNTTKIYGKVSLYSPSKSTEDIGNEFDLVDKNVYSLHTEQLRPGRWIVKVNWSDSLRSYYKEQEIYISRT